MIDLALYHFSVTQIKRSAGSSAIASAAYRAGERLHSDRYDEVNDFTKKGGVLFSEILLPPQAPESYKDRETLWNAVEAVERRTDAQLAYSFDIALQNEFTEEENRELVRQFIMENLVARGMVVDYAIHDPDKRDGGIKNPHFHVMCPIRPINPDGTWGSKQRQVPVLDENGNKVWDERHHRWKFNAVPTTDWGSPETLEEWRKNWCDLVNARFAKKGLSTRIDHRSYERQGIDLLPQIHEGPAVRAMESKGIRTEKGDFNRWVRATNSLLRSVRLQLSSLVEWIREAKAELHKQRAPDIRQILLDYMELQRQGREHFSGYGKQKAGVTTLKDVASAIQYLKSHEIHTAEEMEERLSDLTAEVNEIGDVMKDKTMRMKQLKEAIRQTGIYKENLPVWQEMQQPRYRFKKARAAYEQQHESQLTLLRMARRVMRQAGMPDHYDPAVAAAWRQELARLQSEYDTAYARLRPVRDEQRQLQYIRYCVNRVIDTDKQRQEVAAAKDTQQNHEQQNKEV